MQEICDPAVLLLVYCDAAWGVVDQKKTMSHLGMNVCSILDTVEINWGRKLAGKGNRVRNPTIADQEVPTPLLFLVFSLFSARRGEDLRIHISHHDDRRPSKFIVLADNMKSAINRAWEHGGADFQSRFDKSTGQAQEMKEGALRVL